MIDLPLVLVSRSLDGVQERARGEREGRAEQTTDNNDHGASATASPDARQAGIWCATGQVRLKAKQGNHSGGKASVGPRLRGVSPLSAGGPGAGQRTPLGLVGWSGCRLGVASVGCGGKKKKKMVAR